MSRQGHLRFGRFILLALFGICLWAQTGAQTGAQTAQLSLGPQTVQPDGTVTVPVLLSTSGLSVSAIQVDLLSNNSILSIAATAGQSASNASKTLYGATVANSQQRFVLYGLNQIGITDGSIINLVLTPAQTSLPGPYELTLLNVVAISPDGSSASASIFPGATPPVIPPAGLAVVNGASLALSAVAPGEIVTLFGSGWGLSGASGIAVTFNGVSAPVVYAGANQINAVVPFEMAGQTGAAASVTYFGRQIGASIVGLTAVAPAAFTIGDGGAGQAAVVNQDTTLNSASQPAARGSTVSVYATGVGAMNPQLQDGEVVPVGAASAPVAPIAINFYSGVAASVTYAGPAPGLVAGVLQINFVVPPGITPGPAVAFSLSAGDVQSPLVTMAVN